LTPFSRPEAAAADRPAAVAVVAAAVGGSRPPKSTVPLERGVTL